MRYILKFRYIVVSMQTRPLGHNVVKKRWRITRQCICS